MDNLMYSSSFFTRTRCSIFFLPYSIWDSKQTGPDQHDTVHKTLAERGKDRCLCGRPQGLGGI